MRCLATTSAASASLPKSIFARSGRPPRTQQRDRRRAHTRQLSPRPLHPRAVPRSPTLLWVSSRKRSDASAWNRHQKHPQLTFYQMQTKKMSLWFVFLLLKLTSSPRFQIAATFLPLCAGSPPPPFVFHHHLIVILSCLHVGAIIELRTLWNDFAKK